MLGACDSSASHVTAPHDSTTSSSSSITVPPKPSRLANRVSPDPNGFVGYRLRGQVREISATWRVPTIASTSLDGRASSWVGAEDAAHDFVQIGTREERRTEGDQTTDVYDVFWSDTDLDFHPHRLGTVQRGDIVTAEMVQRADGWDLNVTDVTHPMSRRLGTLYGANTSFTDAQWFQEDPVPHALHPVNDYPYPTMSTVTFTHLRLNGRAPILAYADAHALVSPNGVVLVPTPIADDGFSLPPPTGPQARYLSAVAPNNAAWNAVYSDLKLGSQSEVASDTSAYIEAIDDEDARLGSQTWPPNATAAIGSLIHANEQERAELRAWIATPAPSLRTFLKIGSDGRAHAAANQIRHALGLPPV
jgi:Peptidase A4 family